MPSVVRLIPSSISPPLIGRDDTAALLAFLFLPIRLMPLVALGVSLIARGDRRFPPLTRHRRQVAHRIGGAPAPENQPRRPEDEQHRENHVDEHDPAHLDQPPLGLCYPAPRIPPARLPRGGCLGGRRRSC